ncbi:MAG: M23 family metallopeptidase [Clostridia bacterium]|nr:M23 family metallopeptidase [Clostridia bacterium]
MNNDKKQTNKKLYIALLVCTIAAIIAIVVTAIAVGVTSTTPNPDTPGITTPNDNIDPNKPSDGSGNGDGDNNGEGGGTTPEQPDDQPSGTTPDDQPTATTPQYGSPLSSYTLGIECKLEELVWSNTLHWYSTHNGVDFHAEGTAEVLAVYDGTVTEVKYTTQDGYVITVAQTDGLTATYKSLSADTLVEEGDIITTGTTIGYISDSMMSEQNDGAHLHLEMRDGSGNYVDPMTKLPEGTEK